MTEPKYKLHNFGKAELYHNGGSPASGRIGNFFFLNGADQMPAQGTADNQRNGDRIYASGYALRMLFGQKYDRPNVTFKVYVLQVRAGATVNIDTMFESNTGNILLDTPNNEACKVIASKTYKPLRSAMLALDAGLISGNDVTKEYTFARKLWIPRKKEYKFTSTSAIAMSNDDNIVLAVFAYDAYGTLIEDNIAYVQIWQKFAYRDP